MKNQVDMKTIGVFCGGFSSEYEISIKSATTILSALPKNFDCFPILVHRESWTVDYHGQKIPLDLNDLSFVVEGQKRKVDIGLVYIHGDPGENGKVQAFLEMKGLPCINSSALASELSFDKWFCNQFIKGFGVHVAESILLLNINDRNDEEIVDALGLPVFVKPADSGSSFGISRVNNVEELRPALVKAFAEGETVVVEAFLDGVELTCGVYCGKNGVEALPVTEIVTELEFFDYEAKYLGKSDEITPARISPEDTQKVQEVAMKVYKLLRLKSISRIDFMLVKGVPFVIEVNTTPGFSAMSIVPKMLEVKGMSIPDFWKEILEIELPASYWQ